MHWDSKANDILQLQTRAGGVIMLRDPVHAAAWLDQCQTRPRGFAATYNGLEVVAYKRSTDETWSKC